MARMGVRWGCPVSIESLCAQAGWRFERLGVPDAVLLANVRWL